MKYAAGQRWNYRTREQDVGSKVTVLRVELVPELGEVVFISVDGLRVVDESAPGGIRSEIGFTYLLASALDQSVTSLDSEVAVPDHQELYEGWRRAFEHAGAEVFREPVARIVERLQAMLSSS